MRSWRCRQVTHRPGRSTTALHDVSVARPGGSIAREQVVLRVRAGVDGVEGWVVPDDPSLPGLRAALADDGAVLRAYRPGRRAVVEVGGRDGPGRRVFRKGSRVRGWWRSPRS